MATNTHENPWKGLNFYTEGEVLYGRNAEIQSLSQYIFNNTQTVLYGRSGIGKSSILNAGIFPRSRQEGMVPVGIRLKHDKTSNYIGQIRTAITASGLTARAILPPVRGEEDETLWEFLHRHTFHDAQGEQKVPLFVIDQFEEIFTLQGQESIKKDFFRQLGNLLNDVKPSYIAENERQHRQQQGTQKETTVVTSGTFKGMSLTLNRRRDNAGQPDTPRYLENPTYHIVFSMREDFLSSLELYTSYIPVMRENRFGLLPINEEQACDIICLPREGLVDKDVAKIIIEQVTGRSDFELDGHPEVEVDSAVLSLFLSRLYTKKPENEQAISAELVKSQGGHIIHDFYVDSVTSNEQTGETLSKETILLLENSLLTSEGRRNNVSRSDLLAQGVSESELSILIDKRKLLRQFHHGNDIRIEYIHDILCPVVKERREQRELIQRQEEELRRQQEEKARMQAEAERKQREVEEKAAREKAEMQKRARMARRRTRRIFALTGICIVGLLICIAYYYYANIHTYTAYYTAFTRKNGWPVGVGQPMSASDRAHTPIYYCLSHKGSHSPLRRLIGQTPESDVYTDVEIMSSNTQLPHRPRIATFEVADLETRDTMALAYNKLLSNIHRLHFVGGDDNTIEKEVALDDKDSMLYVVNFFHINSNEMWGTFVTPSGQPMQIRGESRIDRMKISTDSLGRIRSLMYYDQNCVSQAIRDSICGYAWKYGEAGQADSLYLLNEFSLPRVSGYNLVVTQTAGDTTTVCFRHVVTMDSGYGREATGPEGFSKVVAFGDKAHMYLTASSSKFSTRHLTRDDKGNVLSDSIANNLSSVVPTIVRYAYNSDGERIRAERLNASGKPFVRQAGDVYLYEWDYADGKCVKEIHRTPQGIAYQHVVQRANGVTRELLEDVEQQLYLLKVDSTLADGSSTSFYGRDNRPINHVAPIEEDVAFSYHRMRIVRKGKKEERYFYVTQDDGTEGKAPLIQDDWGKALSYYCKVVVRDNEGNIVSYKKLDEEMRVVKSMMFFTLNGQVIGRAVQGVDGKPVRCQNWEEEGFLYYRIYYSKDYTDLYVRVRGVNEWGQHSIFNMSGESADGYRDIVYSEFKDKQLNDENVIQRSYKQALQTEDTGISTFSYPFLHILDRKSPLYVAGLRDGDRIVRFGTWTIDAGAMLLSSSWRQWTTSGNKVSIEVLRPDPASGTIERVSRQVTCTADGANLQEYHVARITNEEYEYLKSKAILK